MFVLRPVASPISPPAMTQFWFFAVGERRLWGLWEVIVNVWLWGRRSQGLDFFVGVDFALIGAGVGWVAREQIVAGQDR